MTYWLCIKESYYRMGFFRMERFTDLAKLEIRRGELADMSRKMWVQ